MNLYLNNLSAMRFWCMIERPLDAASSPSTICEVKEAATSLRGLDIRELLDILGNPEKLHVLIGNPNLRHHSPNLIFHVHEGTYPRGAFRRFSTDVLVASPELCFLEMANELSFFKLVEFGFLLCGDYTVNPKAANPNKRGPLSNKRRIGRFLANMKKTRGCYIARQALDFVFEGSASPRETKTAILLCFPKRLGGYGIERPIMNHRIDFTQAEQELFGKPYVVLDLYWPHYRFGIEYDGSGSHTGDQDVSNDRRKSSELNYRGITVFRVDKDQLKSEHDVFVLAKKCARIMGKPFRKPTPEQWEKKQLLFDAIMKRQPRTSSRQRTRNATEAKVSTEAT